MIEYIIIAIIQGLFEWLPISSSGQVMIVAISFFGISPSEAFSLAIWLHLGTSISVLVKYRQEFIKILKSFNPKDIMVDEIDIRRRNWIIYATLGTAITGLPLYFLFRMILVDSFTAAEGDIVTLLIAGLLIITGVVLIKTNTIYGDRTLTSIPKENISKESILVGLAQGVAILPGVSRSGMSVSAIMLENYEQDNALELSFLMSVPVAFASIGVDIIFGEGSVFGSLDLLTIIVITAISFLVGYLSMEVLLKVAKKLPFGYFCILYGVIAFAVIVPFMIASI